LASFASEDFVGEEPAPWTERKRKSRQKIRKGKKKMLSQKKKKSPPGWQEEEGKGSTGSREKRGGIAAGKRTRRVLQKNLGCKSSKKEKEKGTVLSHQGGTKARKGGFNESVFSGGAGKERWGTHPFKRKGEVSSYPRRGKKESRGETRWKGKTPIM